jgi:hypothetical protein
MEISENNDIVYFINNNNIWSSENQFIPSDYILPGTNKAIEYLCDNYINDYILCVKYDDNTTQLGFSETSNSSDEDLEVTMLRGIAEEINILFDVSTVKKAVMKYFHRKRRIHSYCLKIEDTTEIVQLNNVKMKKRKDRYYKALILLHGSANVLRDKINKFSSCETGIIGFVLVPVKKVCELYNLKHQ